MGRKALLRDIHGVAGVRHHKSYAAGAKGHIRVPTKDLESPELETPPQVAIEAEPVTNESESPDNMDDSVEVEDQIEVVEFEDQTEEDVVEAFEEVSISKPAKKKRKDKSKKKKKD